MAISSQEQNEYQGYLDDAEFVEFVRDSARHALAQATIEELAEFAFGGVDEAVEMFEAEEDTEFIDDELGNEFSEATDDEDNDVEEPDEFDEDVSKALYDEDDD